MPVTLGEAGREVTLLTLDDAEPRGRRVLVRVDYNVPLAGGEVADATRLEASLPTVTELLERGGRLILMSHLGRPKGEDDALRMAPVARALGRLLDRPVRSVPDIVGETARKAARELSDGGVLLLENLRFHPGEKADDPQFAGDLASLGELYVDDAFGTAHRASASIVGVAALLPAYAGRLLERELSTLGTALHHPARPFIALLGGAKISDKLGVLENLAPKADAVLVGGGMANTLLAAQGVNLADSLVENGSLDDARRLLETIGDRLVLPTDLVVADALSADARTQVMPVTQGVPPGWRALDIGPVTVRSFADYLEGARAVVWNGPMGVFEMPAFAKGTFGLAEAVARLKGRAVTVVGGGDSAAALQESGHAADVTWVSTGGGAMLALLAGEDLPGVAALARAAARV